jgi:hypothetical protein
VHVLHRESRYGSSKVRNFIDLLASHLRAHPQLAAPGGGEAIITQGETMA